MKLSIIIPCRNEEASIEECLKRVLHLQPEAEVLVVDSALDATFQRVQTLQREFPNLRYLKSIPDRGKGDAISQGIEAAQGDYLLQLDADLQFLPEEIPLLLEPLLKNQADLTLGSRFAQGSKRLAGSTPALRTFGNHCISAWTSFLCGQKVSDAMAGFKAWRKEVTQSFSLSCHDFSYEVELILKARQNHWRVLDIPITTDARKKGESTLAPFKTGFQVLRNAFWIQYSQGRKKT